MTQSANERRGRLVQQRGGDSDYARTLALGLKRCPVFRVRRCLRGALPKNHKEALNRPLQDMPLHPHPPIPQAALRIGSAAYPIRYAALTRRKVNAGSRRKAARRAYAVNRIWNVKGPWCGHACAWPAQQISYSPPHAEHAHAGCGRELEMRQRAGACRTADPADNARPTALNGAQGPDFQPGAQGFVPPAACRSGYRRSNMPGIHCDISLPQSQLRRYVGG
jgi:hypothetical protein